MAILVAYDGSEPAQKAATHAFQRYSDEEIVLLRVVEAADGSTGAGIELAKEYLADRREAASEDVVEEVADLAGATEADYRTEVAVGNPAREIVSFAEDDEEEIEHIVIGNHGRSGVSRVLLGSVAEKVVRRSPVPVTVVR
ncbi:universal stress protein [Natrarchaeobaculum aegyptiacum]|uniref:Universal stress protein UspA n=1 Tax=Natrarchaeobaculum aegyptiacum TaxID=745377 RepID=A0A2Z2HRN9_9EURY|nr:universal stress protein [Natrarchaeobaculum aegyptiacum]ARS89830.1 universal stress protein UspA [Natrarchaeobaculum aegyptiacum]